MKKVVGVAADGYETVELRHGEYRHTRMQNTDPYYAQNQKLRKAIDKAAVTRKGSWALPIGQIPFADYQNLVKKNPELNSRNAEEQTKAWLKTLKSGVCEQLRTVPRNLIPDSMKPDAGSLILPSRIQKHLTPKIT